MTFSYIFQLKFKKVSTKLSPTLSALDTPPWCRSRATFDRCIMGKCEALFLLDDSVSDFFLIYWWLKSSDFNYYLLRKEIAYALCAVYGSVCCLLSFFEVFQRKLKNPSRKQRQRSSAATLHLALVASQRCELSPLTSLFKWWGSNIL